MSPSSGQQYFVGQPVVDVKGLALQAQTTDPIDAPNTALVVWTSNVEGQLGVGLDVAPTFNEIGTEIVTATATDSEGFTAQAEITVQVVAAPTDTVIVLPVPNQTVIAGLPIMLDGFSRFGIGGFVDCSDLSWTDDVPGEPLQVTPGVGCSLPATFNALGPHQITLAAAATSVSAAGQAGW